MNQYIPKPYGHFGEKKKAKLFHIQNEIWCKKITVTDTS